MSSNKNPRISILPAEWSINFKGPILGHIEHPQNCFLSTVDVDYSGGKDMSFIESAAADIRTEYDICTPETGVGEKGKNHRVQHYPNGINLSLTFKEILNIDRLRYVGRVAAKAKGQSQDTMNELENFELGRGNRLGQDATEPPEPVKPRPKLNNHSSISRVTSRGKINEWNKKYGATHNPDGSPRNAQGNTPRGT